MKFKRLLVFLLLFIPFNVYGYSNKVYLGGKNIGIEVKTNGVLVVGLYEVNNKLIADESKIIVGDYILSVNGNNIHSISDYSKEILDDDDKEYADVTYKRNNNIYETKLKIDIENNEYKTGLYLKDTVSGLGTLSLIDPESNKFIALGHQIQDTVNNKILEIDGGNIYGSYITGVKKSYNGNIGEKEGSSDLNNSLGTIDKNTIKGIIGTYDEDKSSFDLIDIGEPIIGNASILTMINNESINKYDIKIEKIDKKDNLKNILFSVTDKELLDNTGGIVQGMSGSPIIQEGHLVGAVTHVIVDDPSKGYGIFITSMLEELDN